MRPSNRCINLIVLSCVLGGAAEAVGESILGAGGGEGISPRHRQVPSRSGARVDTRRVARRTMPRRVTRNTETPTTTPSPSATAMRAREVPSIPTPTRARPVAVPTQPRPQALVAGGVEVPTPVRTLPCTEDQQRSSSGATVYGYNEESVLSSGKGFDPEDITRSYLSCLQLDRDSGIVQQDEPGYRDARVSISEIKTREALYRELGLDIKAFAQTRVAKVGGSFSRTRDETTQSDSLVFVISGRVDFGKFSLSSFNLKPPYDAWLLDENRHDDFFRRCGEMVVTGAQKEIRFAIVYEFSNLKRGTKVELDTKFRAAYSAGVAKSAASLDFTDAVENLDRRSKVKINVTLRGGGDSAGNLLACLIDSNLTDPYDVKKCLSDNIRNVANPDLAVPLRFYATPWSIFGFRKCFQPGIARRDDRLADLYSEYEEMDVLEERLDSLITEVEQHLVPSSGVSEDLAGQATDVRADVITLKRQLEDQINLCACGGPPVGPGLCPDRRDYLSNCRSPNELRFPPTPTPAAIAPRPALPLEIADHLFNTDRWSFFRWCEEAIDRGNDDSSMSMSSNIPEFAKTVIAINNQFGGLALGCRALHESASRASTLNLSGFDGGDLAPIRSLRALTSLSVVGSGTYFCDGEPGPIVCSTDGIGRGEACMDGTNVDNSRCVPTTPRVTSLAKLPHNQLTALRLEGLGLNAGAVDSLLIRTQCSDGAPCASNADCATGECARLTRAQSFPNLLELNLARNNLESPEKDWPLKVQSLNLADNSFRELAVAAKVREAFSPMLALRRLDLQEPGYRNGSGLIRNRSRRPVPTTNACDSSDSNQEVGDWRTGTSRAKSFLASLASAVTGHPVTLTLVYSWMGEDGSQTDGCSKQCRLSVVNELQCIPSSNGNRRGCLCPSTVQ